MRHFTLEDHVFKSTGAAKIDIEGEINVNKTKNHLNFVCRKCGINHEELRIEYAQNTGYEFLRELTNTKCRNLQSNK